MITVKLCSRDPAPPPIEYVKGGGGIFKDMAVHDLDMARFLMGCEPVKVLAMGSCQVSHPNPNPNPNPKDPNPNPNPNSKDPNPSPSPNPNPTQVSDVQDLEGPEAYDTATIVVRFENGSALELPTLTLASKALALTLTP